MLLLVAFLIILAMLSNKVSAKFGLPLLIGFILIGIIVGSDVLNLLYFDDAKLTKRVADVLLIFIIFDGGFRVTRSAFKSVAGPSLTLATLGVALTALILSLLIRFALGLDLLTSLIVASIISSTDAAAVFMITKANPIKARLATTLNVESAANDPMAIILTITFIQVATGSFTSPVTAALLLVWQFVGGVVVGYVCFRVSRFLFTWLRSDNRGDYNVLLLGCILLAFGIADALQANGIIAVFFMGYWLGNSDFPAKRATSSFMESVSAIFNITLFIMLGLLAFPHRFSGIWVEALLIVFFVMFVARPLAVYLSTIPFGYSMRERVFLMWGGIKGAVPIVLATYPMASGLDGDGFIFDSIFFAVFLSCVIQGTTLGPLSRLLGLTEKKRRGSPHTLEIHSLSSSELDMFELHVGERSPCAGRTIAQLGLGADVLISSIVRDGKLIPPKGNTAIIEHDILFVLARPDQISDIEMGINGQFCR